MMVSKELTKYVIIHEDRNNVDKLGINIQTYESFNYCLMRARFINCVVPRGLE